MGSTTGFAGTRRTGCGYAAWRPALTIRRGARSYWCRGLGALGYLLDTLTGCAAWARSYLLDVPGFGHRPPRPCRADVGELADLVAAWLSTVAGAPVVLAGHSTAAQIALHAAVRAPDRVRALALFGPTFPPELRAPARLALAYLRTQRHEPASLLKANRRHLARGGPRLIRYVNSARHDEPERLIARPSCPVLIVRGELDTLATPAWVDRLARTARHGRSVTVPGSHVFPCEQGELTAGLLAAADAMSSR